MQSGMHVELRGQHCGVSELRLPGLYSKDGCVL